MTVTINKTRLLIILLLGFSSGLPMSLIASTLQAWFTTAGASILLIGSLSLIGQPYIYKFLWAPFLDRFVPPLFGRRRGWVMITQLGLLISIAVMSLGNPQQHPYLLTNLALLIAFISASQDIAIDAYRTDILAPEERGMGAALFTAGYRIAMVTSGGLALILAAKIGWHATYLSMSLLMIIGLCTTWFAEEPDFAGAGIKPPINLRAAIVEPWKEFLSRKYAIGLLLFIIFYKLGDALSLSLMTPFLIRGLGFSLTTVGVVFKGVGLLATMSGVLLGGLIMTRLSLFRSLFSFGVLQIIAIFTFVALAMVGKNYSMLVSTIAVDSFCNGLGTTALFAYLMSLCDHRYTATQYALFTAFASIGRVFIGPVAGIMLEHMTWTGFFICASIASLPGLGLLWWLRPSFTLAKK